MGERQALGCPALDGAGQFDHLPAGVLDGTQRGADVLHRGHHPVNALGDRELEHRAERVRVMGGTEIVRCPGHQPAGDPGEQVEIPALLRALAPLQQPERAILSIHQITEQGGQWLVLVGDDQAAQVIDELVEGLGADVGRLDTGEEITGPAAGPPVPRTSSPRWPAPVDRQPAQLSCHPTVCLPFTELGPGGPVVALPEFLQGDVPLPQQLLQPRSRRLVLDHPYRPLD
jgi:hypothetical protein